MNEAPGRLRTISLGQLDGLVDDDRERSRAIIEAYLEEGKAQHVAVRRRHRGERERRRLHGDPLVQLLAVRLDALDEALPGTPEIVAARYLVEEYRVALFSQRIGTRGKVSATRLGRVFEPLERRAGLR